MSGIKIGIIRNTTPNVDIKWFSRDFRAFNWVHEQSRKENCCPTCILNECTVQQERKVSKKATTIKYSKIYDASKYKMVEWFVRFKDLFLLSSYVCVHTCACTCVCMLQKLCAHGGRFPWAWVIDGCEPPDMDIENKTQDFCKRSMLLTARQLVCLFVCRVSYSRLTYNCNAAKMPSNQQVLRLQICATTPSLYWCWR